MARRTRARKHQSKRRKGKKGGKLWLILLGLVLPLLYFAFTRLFFDPFEGSLPAFRLLVPQDVDLYLHRERLDSDFEEFPRPDVVARWMRTPEWRELSRTDWYAGTGWPKDMDELVGPLEALLQDTGPLDLLDDVLGKEVAVIGRNPGTAGQLVLLARLSSKGKLAVEALDYDAVASQALGETTRSEVQDPEFPAVRWQRLDPTDGSEPLFFQRVQDLLVAGTDEVLVRDVLRNAAQTSELTVGLSRLYHDNVEPTNVPPSQRFQMEWFADVRHLVDAYDIAPDLTDRSQDALLNVLPRVIDWDLLQEGVGRLELDERRLGATAYVALDTLRAREDKGGLLGAPEFVVTERMGDLLRMMPGSASAVVTANLDLRRFLNAVVAGLDPELVTLLNDTIDGVARWNVNWNVRTVQQLIDELDRVLDGELTVALRPLDREVPAGSQPVPGLAFILPIKDPNGWEAVGQAFINGHQVLGVDEDNMWKVAHGGLGERKHMKLIGMAAEHISFIALEGETLVLTTDDDFTQEIIAAYQGASRPISGQPGVADLLDAFAPAGQREARANVAAWVDAEGLLEILEPYAEWRAELDTQIDFPLRRAQLRKELLQGEYRDFDGDDLPEDVAQELDARLDELLDEEESNRLSIDVPRMAREWFERQQWLELLNQGMGSIRLGERATDVALHLETAVE